jgi:hypothetical protein
MVERVNGRTAGMKFAGRFPLDHKQGDGRRMDEQLDQAKLKWVAAMERTLEFGRGGDLLDMQTYRAWLQLRQEEARARQALDDILALRRRTQRPPA